MILGEILVGVLVTSHESSTDNDSVNGESVQSAAQIGGKQGVEIVSGCSSKNERRGDESENLLEKDYCRLLEEKGK